MERLDRPLVLVTGGAGFLGRHLVHALVGANTSVRIFDQLPPRDGDWPVAVEYVQGDARDRAAVKQAVAGCDAVCHLAGLPQLWAQRRGLFDQVNFHGAVNVLEEAALARCQRILHVSSAAFAPANVGGTRTAGPYSRSKRKAERFALKLAGQGTPLVIAAPTVPIGPGDFHLTPPSRMILDLCAHPRREYLPARLNLIDVRDLAQALLRVLFVGELGRRYLLGNETVALPDLVVMLGQPRPTLQVPFALALVAAHVCEWWANVVSHRPPLVTVEGVRLTRQTPPSAPDADLRRLGVVPRPLDHTLADVVAWYREVGWIS